MYIISCIADDIFTLLLILEFVDVARLYKIPLITQLIIIILPFLKVAALVFFFLVIILIFVLIVVITFLPSITSITVVCITNTCWGYTEFL